MKFRMWLIYKRISKIIRSIYDSRFLYWLRSTLLFNVIKMFVLVLGIVYTLFLFFPSEANIYFSDEVKELEFVANSARGSLETDQINLQIESDCKIRLDNICVDYENTRYENIEYLLLSVEKQAPFGLVGIQNNQTTTSAFFISQKSIGKANSVRCSNKEIILNEGILLGGLDSSEYEFWTISAKITAFTSDNKEVFQATEFNIIVDEDLYGTPYLTTSKKTTLITPNIMRKYNESPVTNYCSMDFDGITTLTYEGSGELLFSPSITPETYSIHEQSVDFHGVPNELEASMMITEDSLENNIALTISGKVNEAHISNMTLFPTFSAWYVKNIYLAPLSLISIVFGSISLMKRKRDE